MCKTIKEITSQSGKNCINLTYVKNLGLTGEEKILDERCVDGGHGYNRVYECLLESGDTFMYCTAGWDSFYVLDFPKLIKKSSKQNYSQKVRKLVKKYKNYFNINMSIGLTLGTKKETYEYIKNIIPFKITEEQYHALSNCGIRKRSSALIEILGDKYIDTNKLGQTGTIRLTNLILWNIE